MRVGSLFSGIGGIDLGLERAGMEIAWQVEIDEWCRKVLTKHWPDVPKYGDIRGLTDLPTVDVLAGGPPCQPVSHAGHRKGADDARWLWPEYLRLIRELRPRYALMENPPAILGRKYDPGSIFGELASCGYDAEWDCLPAASFGAPHLRDRLWILAYPHGSTGTKQGVEQAERASILSGGGAGDVAHTVREGLQGWPSPALSRRGAAIGHIGASDWWTTEPRVCRVGDGIPRTMDRLRGLGNAVVPQIVEWIGRRIMAVDA